MNSNLNVANSNKNLSIAHLNNKKPNLLQRLWLLISPKKEVENFFVIIVECKNDSDREIFVVHVCPEEMGRLREGDRVTIVQGKRDSRFFIQGNKHCDYNKDIFTGFIKRK